MLPVIGIGVLAVHDTREYRASAEAAAHVGREVVKIDAMVRLWQTLSNESVSVTLNMRASETHLSVDALARVLGYGRATGTAVARAATDAALGALVETSPAPAAAIDALRRGVDAKTIAAPVATASFLALCGKVAAAIAPRLSSLGRTTERVGGGDRLTANLGLLQATADALQFDTARANDLSDLVVTSTPTDQVPSALVRLGADNARYELAATALAATPDATIAAAWKKLTIRADVRGYEQTITMVAQGRRAQTASGPAVVMFKGAVSHYTGLFGIVSSASRLVERQARALQSSSEATYHRWLVALALIGVFMAGVALALARSIIRPLRALAASARSVGAGQLAVEPASVHGPRETTVVGEAFNDLVANLRLLEGKSRALAAGDFDDPVLAMPLPGRLGESIASSVRVLSGSIEERDALQQRLSHQAFHDMLTGLANRALFLDRVEHALRRSERQTTPVAVLFLDIDDFKTVNDSLGHATGDDLLVAVGERIVGAARASDTVASFGGDEFAVLVEPGDMPQTAKEVAGRIADALEAPFRLGETDVVVSVSVGIAIGASLDDTPADLLRDADMAMYLAKRNGKDRFEMFRVGLQDEASTRLAMTADLRRAIEDAQLEVFYQPIVTAHDAIPTGAEALVRWNHPRRGLVLPAEFIGVAESTGLIVPLGNWVLNQACRQTQAWRQDGVVDDDFYIAVNLSARQLAEPTLVDTVIRALDDSGLPASALVLEITESTLMVNFDAGLARLWALKELGLGLALDDYGTGYSSLNRLGKLPIDIVKIDKTFVDQLTLKPEGAAVIKSVIDVTAALGLVSLAEGVEQKDQLAALDNLGCDNIQGYLFAEPMPSVAAASTLQQLRTAQGTNGPPRRPQGVTASQ